MSVFSLLKKYRIQGLPYTFKGLKDEKTIFRKKTKKSKPRLGKPVWRFFSRYIDVKTLGKYDLDPYEFSFFSGLVEKYYKFKRSGKFNTLDFFLED